MNIDNEKELWEAFRNQAPTIVVEGDLVSRVKKWRVVTKTGWIYAIGGLFFAAGLGLLVLLFGISVLISAENCGPEGIVVFLFVLLLSMIPGLLVTLFGILLALGKLGGICGQLAKYRAKEEWGVLTLTRK